MEVADAAFGHEAGGLVREAMAAFAGLCLRVLTCAMHARSLSSIT